MEVNVDRLEEEIAPYVQGVDVALAAFGVGKGSAKMGAFMVSTQAVRFDLPNLAHTSLTAGDDAPPGSAPLIG